MSLLVTLERGRFGAKEKSFSIAPFSSSILFLSSTVTFGSLNPSAIIVQSIGVEFLKTTFVCPGTKKRCSQVSREASFENVRTKLGTSMAGAKTHRKEHCNVGPTCIESCPGIGASMLLLVVAPALTHRSVLYAAFLFLSSWLMISPQLPPYFAKAKPHVAPVSTIRSICPLECCGIIVYKNLSHFPVRGIQSKETGADLRKRPRKSFRFVTCACGGQPSRSQR